MLRLITTNDLHSCCDRFADLGAAWAQLEAEETLPTLHLDAGDWFSGTVYSTLGPNSTAPVAPELEFFHAHNVVAALGNHELDATAHGLANMLTKAQAAGYRGLVCSNIVLDTSQPDSAATRLSQLFTPWSADAPAAAGHRRPLSTSSSPTVLNEALLQEVAVFGLVGIIGLLGPDAVMSCEGSTHGTGISYLDWKASTKKAVQLARDLRQCGARVVIALLHGGRQEVNHTLRAAVDFIACGHTHEVYHATQDSHTAQAGCAGARFGVHVLSVHEQQPQQQHKTQLVSSKIVQNPRRDRKHRHPTYHTHVRPLFRSLHDKLDPGQELVLPADPAAHLPITRTFNDPFARWLMDATMSELNYELQRLQEPPCHGVFFANEGVRGDFTDVEDGKLTFKHLVEVLEIGTPDPDRFGSDVAIVEMNGAQALFLRGLFYLATRLVTDNALPTYSTGFGSLPQEQTSDNKAAGKHRGQSFASAAAFCAVFVFFLTAGIELLGGAFLVNQQLRVLVWCGLGAALVALCWAVWRRLRVKLRIASTLSLARMLTRSLPPLLCGRMVLQVHASLSVYVARHLIRRAKQQQ